MPTPSRERDVGGIISTRAIWGALGANPWFKRTLLTRFEIPGQSSEVGGSSYGVVNTSRWHTRALLHVYLLADFFFSQRAAWISQGCKTKSHRNGRVRGASVGLARHRLLCNPCMNVIRDPSLCRARGTALSLQYCRNLINYHVYRAVHS